MSLPLFVIIKIYKKRRQSQSHTYCVKWRHTPDQCQYGIFLGHSFTFFPQECSWKLRLLTLQSICITCDYLQRLFHWGLTFSERDHCIRHATKWRYWQFRNLFVSHLLICLFDFFKPKKVEDFQLVSWVITFDLLTNQSQTCLKLYYIQITIPGLV